jgi:hypothetical protein
VGRPSRRLKRGHLAFASDAGKGDDVVVVEMHECASKRRRASPP